MYTLCTLKIEIGTRPICTKYVHKCAHGDTKCAQSVHGVANAHFVNTFDEKNVQSMHMEQTKCALSVHMVWDVHFVHTMSLLTQKVCT
jgi:hypothetical protein